MIIDTHAHLDLVKKNYLNKLIENAKNARVKIIITNAIDLNSCKKVLDLSKRFDIVKPALGLYPEKLSLEKLEKFKKFLFEHKKEVFAIGEIGMDFKWHEDKKLQEKIFREQLKLAEELKLPAIIHSREAEAEVVEILKDYNCKKIMHCFMGNFKLVKKAEELGCYFSIPTNIVRSEHFQKMVRMLPKDKILTETDSPYLSPFKGKKNESAFIVESIKIISKIWGLTKEETEKQIEDNFERLFKE